MQKKKKKVSGLRGLSYKRLKEQPIDLRRGLVLSLYYNNNDLREKNQKRYGYDVQDTQDMTERTGLT